MCRAWRAEAYATPVMRFDDGGLGVNASAKPAAAALRNASRTAAVRHLPFPMLAVQRELPYGARLHLPLLEKRVSDLSLMLDDDGIGSAYGWNSRNVNPSMMALLLCGNR